MQHEPGGLEYGAQLDFAGIQGKNVKQRVLKTAFAEVTYIVWKSRNEKVFGGESPDLEIWKSVCYNIIIVCARVSLNRIYMSKL